MAELRRPRLPRAALWLGAAAPLSIVGGFVLSFGALAMSDLSRRAGEFAVALPVLAVAAGLSSAVAAVVAGHVALGRYPRETQARVGLWIGYGTLGASVVVGGLMVATWWWMMQHYR